MTWTPLSRSKSQRSRSPDRFARRRVGASGGCSGGRERVGRGKLLLRCRLLGGERRFGALGGRRGAGHTVAAARLQLVWIRIIGLQSGLESGATAADRKHFN